MKTARILLLLAILLMITMMVKAQNGTKKNIGSGSLAITYKPSSSLHTEKFICFSFSPYTPDSVKMSLQECIKFLIPNECSFWGKFQRFPSCRYEPSVDVHISWKKESYDCTADEFVEMIYR